MSNITSYDFIDTDKLQAAQVEFQKRLRNILNSRTTALFELGKMQTSRLAQPNPQLIQQAVGQMQQVDMQCKQLSDFIRVCNFLVGLKSQPWILYGIETLQGCVQTAYDFVTGVLIEGHQPAIEDSFAVAAIHDFAFNMAALYPTPVAVPVPQASNDEIQEDQAPAASGIVLQ